jgi:hypothetical protein
MTLEPGFDRGSEFAAFETDIRGSAIREPGQMDQLSEAWMGLQPTAEVRYQSHGDPQ